MSAHPNHNPNYGPAPHAAPATFPHPAQASGIRLAPASPAGHPAGRAPAAPGYGPQGGAWVPPHGSVAGLLALANLKNQMLEGQSRALLVMACRAGAPPARRVHLTAGPDGAPQPAAPQPILH